MNALSHGYGQSFDQLVNHFVHCVPIYLSQQSNAVVASEIKLFQPS